MATPLQSSSQVQGHHSNGLFGSYRENVQIPWRARVFGKIVQYAPLKTFLAATGLASLAAYGMGKISLTTCAIVNLGALASVGVIRKPHRYLSEAEMLHVTRSLYRDACEEAGGVVINQFSQCSKAFAQAVQDRAGIASDKAPGSCNILLARWLQHPKRPDFNENDFEQLKELHQITESVSYLSAMVTALDKFGLRSQRFHHSVAIDKGMHSMTDKDSTWWGNVMERSEEGVGEMLSHMSIGSAMVLCLTTAKTASTHVVGVYKLYNPPGESVYPDGTIIVFDPNAGTYVLPAESAAPFLYKTLSRTYPENPRWGFIMLRNPDSVE